MLALAYPPHLCLCYRYFARVQRMNCMPSPSTSAPNPPASLAMVSFAVCLEIVLFKSYSRLHSPLNEIPLVVYFFYLMSQSLALKVK